MHMAATTTHHTPRPKVIEGFGRLTLNPAPRLAKTRREMAEKDRVAEAWIDVGRALHEAIVAVSRTIHSS